MGARPLECALGYSSPPAWKSMSTISKFQKQNVVGLRELQQSLKTFKCHALGLCWHPTQPEIEQLQGTPPELLCKEVLLQYLSGIGLCWHRTQPAIGQLQAYSELRCKEALFASALHSRLRSGFQGHWPQWRRLVSSPLSSMDLEAGTPERDWINRACYKRSEIHCG